MIEVDSLTKDYGTITAVQDLSFQVKAGEVVGFLGPNGAGKSTTLRILAGFLGATSGTVKVAGHDVTEDPLSARRAMGYMPESSPLYSELRVGEYLTFRARLKGIPRRRQKESIAEAMSMASVTDVSRTLIRHLSKGYRQRVGLSDALLGSPPLLILDEPTAGLDPNQIREVRTVIRGLRENHTVLISTHILSEVEAMCDRAMVMDRGRLVASGPLSELRARASAKGARFSVRGHETEVRAALSQVSVVAKVEAVHGSVGAEASGGAGAFRVAFKNGADAQAGVEDVVKALVDASLGVREALVDAASLEEVFAQLTLGEGPRS